MIPSKYQQAIYSWIQTGFGNGIVEAVAGSGKTTTIVNATKVIPADKKICFLAFNKSIAEELKAKLPAHCEASTLNSLGHRAWMRHMQSIKLDANKTSTIMFDCLTADEMRQFGANIKRLVSLAKAHLVVPKSVYADQKIGTEDNEDVWLGFIDKYDIELNIPADVSDKEFQKQTSDCIKLAQRVLELSCEVKNIIDFDDQIYLTTVFKARTGRYDFVFVDEAQDLNPAQMTMIQSLSGRIVAIGDSRQCHPAGTMVEVTGGTRIPIESITAGTQVVTYHDCFRGLKTQGRKVLETSSRKYAGDMLTIHAGKEVVRVTPNHRVPTRLNGKKKCWAIYLMEKDKTTRIGCCVAMYKQGFGPA